MKRILNLIEFTGLVVLLLVTIALTRITTIQYLSVWSIEFIVYITMVILIILSIVIGLLHTTNRLGTLTSIRKYFGALLFFVGGSVFFFLTEYLHLFLESRLDFWNKVSIYSLPAICVVGGIFTLYTEIIERNISRQHEFIITSTLSLMSVLLVVTSNFLVLNNIILQSHYISIVRSVVFSICILGLLYVQNKKPPSLLP